MVSSEIPSTAAEHAPLSKVEELLISLVRFVKSYDPNSEANVAARRAAENHRQVAAFKELYRDGTIRLMNRWGILTIVDYIKKEMGDDPQFSPQKEVELRQVTRDDTGRLITTPIIFPCSSFGSLIDSGKLAITVMSCSKSGHPDDEKSRNGSHCITFIPETNTMGQQLLHIVPGNRHDHEAVVVLHDVTGAGNIFTMNSVARIDTTAQMRMHVEKMIRLNQTFWN